MAFLNGDTVTIWFARDAAVVPLPASAGLLGFAIAGLGWVGWRPRGRSKRNTS